MYVVNNPSHTLTIHLNFFLIPQAKSSVFLASLTYLWALLLCDLCGKDSALSDYKYFIQRTQITLKQFTGTSHEN